MRHISELGTIAEAKRTARPSGGMHADGYTVRSGAPSSLLVRLERETRWRRVYVYQVSNAGTAFVRVRGQEYTLSDCDLPNEKD